jgi:hypothetical protein
VRLANSQALADLQIKIQEKDSLLEQLKSDHKLKGMSLATEAA